MTSTDKAQLIKLAQAMLEANGAAGICGPIPGTDNFIVVDNQEWIDRQASAGASTTAASAVPADLRAQVLHEAADMLDAMNDSSGDAAAYDNREMTIYEAEREDAIAACVKKLRDAAAAPSAALSEKAEPQWISVDERLPPFCTTVLVHSTKSKAVPVDATYVGTHPREVVEDEQITHWMPLPSAPASTKDQAASKGGRDA